VALGRVGALVPVVLLSVGDGDADRRPVSVDLDEVDGVAAARIQSPALTKTGSERPSSVQESSTS
jgi:hypothetical protein